MRLYDQDSFARDVAFEVNLGGDRLDSADVSVILSGVSAEQLTAFKRRVYYHSVDFAPVGGYHDEHFLTRSVDNICSTVKLGEGRGDIPNFYSMPCDRGKWFRRDDGRYFKCTKAVRWAMWKPEQLERLGIDPVTIQDVTMKKVSFLLDNYGTDILLDRPARQIELLSYSAETPGYGMVIEQRKDDASAIRVKYLTPHGFSETSFKRLDDEDTEKLFSTLDKEVQWRSEHSRKADVVADEPQATVEQPVSLAMIPLESEAVLVCNPASPASDPLQATAVFETSDGVVMVSCRPFKAPEGTPEENIPLSSFSDRSLETIREATGRSMKLFFDKVQKPSLDDLRPQMNGVSLPKKNSVVKI